MTRRHPHSIRQTAFSATSTRLFCLTIVLLLPIVALAQAPASAQPFQTTPADTLAPDSLAIAPDSLLTDSLSTDSLWTDSLTVDSLRSDTLAEGKPQREPWVILPPDTTAPNAPSSVAITVDGHDFARHGYKDAGEMATILPLLFPHQTQLYLQPFYPIPPGASARSLTVMYRGRPYDNPITDATNFTTYAAEEVQQMHLSNSWDGSGPASSGPVLTIDPPHAYPETALTRVVYRQGFYGLGHADWRIAQQITDDFAYHIGVNIGEYRGRFDNTQANTSMIRVGARQQIRDIGLLQLYWMETRETHGRPFTRATANTRRNDVDIILSGGRPSDPDYRELGFWYARSQRGYRYGDEDGNRLGGRLEWWRELADSTQKIALRGDVERSAARFVRRPNTQDPSAQRLVVGATGRHTWDMDLLRTQTSLRSEFGTRSALPDTVSIDPAFLMGGAFNADLGRPLGLGLLAEVSRSWRWPSLDESFGFWSLRSPDRWMDLVPVPDQTTLYYFGNPTLDVEVSHYGGIGARYNQTSSRSIRLMAGYRRVSDPIEIRYLGGQQYTRRNGLDRSALELTGFGWIDLLFGFSTAASWTLHDATDPSTPYPSTWGWSSLRYDGTFYHGQLRVRLSVTGNYYGEYEYNGIKQIDALILNGLATMRINKFELYYGTQNILSEQYTLFMNYPFEHRSDLWGVRWIMWN